MNWTLNRYILLVSLCLIQGALGANPPSELFGRWQADTVPTGYWIIDRLADGRYAKKAFLSYDYSKSSEIVITWGRWSVKGKKYISIIDGSTSSFVRRFAGEWKSTAITTLTKDHFVFMSSDGHNRSEIPYSGKMPLIDLTMKAPPDLSGPNMTIIKPQLRGVPDWVRSYKIP